ncbi:MAG: YjbQ family protein [Actinobacteria bacterium]|nr:YjbQ family protein [Actinomycetota bacterium]
MVEFQVNSPTRECLVDITHQIQNAVTTACPPEFSGLVHVYVPHTTAAVTVNEGADPDVARDIIFALARMVPRDAGYRHGEGNADAHVKAALLGADLSVPVVDGHLKLGMWQSIFFADFDGPRRRRVWVEFIGALPSGMRA